MPTNIWVTSIALLLMIARSYGEVTLTLTDIRQVMPEGGTDARDHHIQVIASGATDLPDNLLWTLALIMSDGSSFSYNSSITDPVDPDVVSVTFPNPLHDFDYVILIAEDAEEIIQGAFSAALQLRDLKARVAVVGDSENGNAFLRVTTGNLNEVVVDADTKCSQTNKICYFLSKNPENVERCVDLTTTKGQVVKHCDDTFTMFEALKDQPALHLHDNTELTVSYNATPASVEVLLVNSTTGEQIPNSAGISCTVRDQECSLTIGNGINTIDIMVVMFDENGYVVGSDTYPFENYDVSWLGLSNDVLMAKWASSEKSAFEVKLLQDSKPVFQSVLNCGGVGTVDFVGCEVFFAELDLASINTITVQKQNDTNSVGRSGAPGADAPSCTITKITKTPGDEEDVITFEVTSTIGIPSSANIVEIINDADNAIVSNKKCTGEVSVLSPASYSVGCSLTNIAFEGEKKIILISYNETSENGIQEVGTVYADLKAFDVHVHRVGNAAIGVSALWVTKKNSDSFSITNVTCEPNEACYLLDFPTTTETLPVCTKLTNAVDGEDLSQCVITTLEDAGDMSLLKFQLKDRNNIIVTAPFVSKNVHIILYDANDVLETGCTPSPPRVENKTCTTSSIGLPADKQTALLKALLVGTDTDGTVIDSTAVEVEVLKFTYKRLFDDTLTVEWTALNPEGYTTTLQEITALKAISLKDNNKAVPSDIECGDSSCTAFYRDLNSSASYTLTVHKINEPISETQQVIKVGDVEVNDLQEMTIVNVTKIDATKTQITLGTDVNIAFTMNVLVEMPGIQFMSSAEIDSKTQISFKHDIPIFDGAKSTSFILSLLDIDGKFAKKGRAYLDLRDLDSKLAWVAATQGSSQAKSLRVDVGSQEAVDIGARKCLKKDSPCYFIDDKSLPATVERCVPVQNTVDNTWVDQCDTEITSFQELAVANVSLSGNNVEVSVNLENPNDILEVKIYDPANSTALFSLGNVTCDAALNGSATVCMQPLKTPSDRRPVKVLVVEIDSEGVVLKSSVEDISFPATGVESWVIAVSVLASILGATIIVYVVVVVVKKNKSRKAVRKELEIISGDDRSLALDDMDYHSRHEPSPYMSRNPAPPVPRKPTRRDSGPPMGYQGNPYGPSFDNPAFARGERFGDAPVGLPRIQPRMQAGPERPGYY